MVLGHVDVRGGQRDDHLFVDGGLGDQQRFVRVRRRVEGHQCRAAPVASSPDGEPAAGRCGGRICPRIGGSAASGSWTYCFRSSSTMGVVQKNEKLPFTGTIWPATCLATSRIVNRSVLLGIPRSNSNIRRSFVLAGGLGHGADKRRQQRAGGQSSKTTSPQNVADDRRLKSDRLSYDCPFGLELNLHAELDLARGAAHRVVDAAEDRAADIGRWEQRTSTLLVRLVASARISSLIRSLSGMRFRKEASSSK